MVGPISGGGPLQGPQPESEAAAEAEAKQYLQQSGTSTYVDIGVLYGNYVMSHCMNWSPTASIDQTKLDAFLTVLFSSLKADGSDEISMAFAQIGDIEALSQGQGAGLDDPIAQIFKDNYPVGNTGENFLKYFADFAHTSGVKVDLSFGGAAATGATDFTLTDPAKEANDLAAFMKNYDIDDVDFDIEGDESTRIMANGAANVQTFFSTLHSALSPLGKESILTVDHGGGIAGPLQPLFAQGVYSSCFDGLRLMLYGASENFINPDEVKAYLAAGVPPGEIQIGFYDKVDYGGGAGTAADGQAAAQQFLALEKQLGVQLGEPFVWTDDPTGIPSNAFMQAFGQALKNAAHQ